MFVLAAGKKKKQGKIFWVWAFVWAGMFIVFIEFREFTGLAVFALISISTLNFQSYWLKLSDIFLYCTFHYQFCSVGSAFLPVVKIHLCALAKCDILITTVIYWGSLYSMGRSLGFSFICMGGFIFALRSSFLSSGMVSRGYPLGY